MKHPKSLVRDMIGHNDEYEVMPQLRHTFKEHPTKDTCAICYRQRKDKIHK